MHLLIKNKGSLLCRIFKKCFKKSRSVLIKKNPQGNGVNFYFCANNSRKFYFQSFLMRDGFLRLLPLPRFLSKSKNFSPIKGDKLEFLKTLKGLQKKPSRIWPNYSILWKPCFSVSLQKVIPQKPALQCLKVLQSFD